MSSYALPSNDSDQRRANWPSKTSSIPQWIESIMTRLNQLKQLTMRYFGALHSAVAADTTDGAAEMARELGAQAVELGLDTMELAKIHQEALSELTPDDCDKESVLRLTARAAVFFNATLVQIESNHSTAQQINAGLVNVELALLQRTLELADAGRKLKTGIEQRKVADANLKSSKAKSVRLLKELQALEADLKAVTLQLYNTQETERKRMSSRLHEEIAMTLLGIHVRLLSLQKEVATTHTSFTRGIDTTRRLVDQASATINHFNQEFGIQDDS